MMLVFPENGRAGLTTIHAPHVVWARLFGAAFVLLLKLDFRLNRAAIVFSIARNHLIGMTYGKMSPALSSLFTENQPYRVAFRTESRLLRKIYFFFR